MKTIGKDSRQGEPVMRRRLWRRSAAYVLASAAVLIALVAMAGSGPVLRAALPTINRFVSEAIDGNFEVNGLSGSLWSELSVGRMTLHQPQTGFAVELADAAIEWSPMALLGGVFQIDRLESQKLAVTLPSTWEGGDEAQEEGGLPGLPLSLRVGSISVPEISVLRPDTGQVYDYRLTAAAQLDDRRNAALRLNLEPRGDEADFVTADIVYRADSRHLDAKVDGAFDREGLVMALAGLDPAQASDVSFSLSGQGVIDNWHGAVKARASEIAELSGEVTLGYGEDMLPFAYMGNVSVDPALAPDIPDSLLQKIAVSLEGELSKSLEAVRNMSLRVYQGDLIDTQAAGDIDLADNSLSATLQAGIGPELAALLDLPMSWRDLNLRARASGAMDAPAIEADLTGVDFETEAFTAEALSVIGTMEPSGFGMDVSADVVASGQKWTSADLDDLLPPNLDARLEGRLSKDAGRIELSGLELPALAVTARGALSRDDNGTIDDASLVADIADLSLLAPLTGLDLRGAGRLSLTEAGWNAEGGSGELSVRGENLSWGLAELDHIVGASPNLRSRLDLTKAFDLSLPKFDLTLAQADIAGNLRLFDAFGRIEADFTAKAASEIVPTGIDIALAEGGAMAGQLKGLVAEPAGRIDIDIPVLVAGGETFRKMTARNVLGWQGDGSPQIESTASFQAKGRSVEAAMTTVLTPDELRIGDISVSAQGLSLAGAATMPGYEPPLTGQARIESFDATLLQLWDIPVEGGTVSGRLDFTPDGAAQTVKLDLTGKELVALSQSGQPLQINTLTLSGTIANALADPKAMVAVEGNGLSHGDIFLTTAEVDLDGTVSDMTLRADLSGRYAEGLPLALRTTANIGWKDRLTVTASALQAELGDQKLTTIDPVEVGWADSGDLSAKLNLEASGGGRVSADLSLVPAKSAAVRVAIDGLQVGPWAKLFQVAPVKGLARAELDYRETAGSKPEARLNAAISDIGLPDVPDIQPFMLRLDGALAGDALEADLTFGQGDKSILQARAKLNMALSALEPSVALSNGSPIDATVKLDGEIGDYWQYAPLPDHDLSGHVRVDAQISGSMDQPRIHGSLSLKNGQYEHLQYGTLLRDIDLSGVIGGDRLTIGKLTANDGGRGQLSGNLDLVLGPDWEPSFKGRMQAQDMAVVRLDELQAWADIDLQVEGDAAGVTVASRTTVQRGEVDLSAALPSTVPELAIENLPDSEGEDAKNQAGKAVYPATLDVTVNIPGRLFVRGKGLESEWQGNLHISGPAESPKIVGKLTALRGQLDVIGKTFTVRDSTITFTGGQPVDPLLNIAGIHKADDLTVTAAFTGPASAPELRLTSDPAMPQDEILSRVLFGKTQGNLSAVEAVQLASAAAELSGDGGGLDVVGSIRRFIGVDVLRFEGGEDGPTVRAGEYLTDDIYVGTKQGSTPGSTGVEVEIELTPRLKATTETSGADTKAGLQFKYDY